MAWKILGLGYLIILIFIIAVVFWFLFKFKGGLKSRARSILGNIGKETRQLSSVGRSLRTTKRKISQTDPVEDPATTQVTLEDTKKELAGKKSQFIRLREETEEDVNNLNLAWQETTQTIQDIINRKTDLDNLPESPQRSFAINVVIKNYQKLERLKELLTANKTQGLALILQIQTKIDNFLNFSLENATVACDALEQQMQEGQQKSTDTITENMDALIADEAAIEELEQQRLTLQQQFNKNITQITNTTKEIADVIDTAKAATPTQAAA
jgi:hypothetical protein